MINIRYEIYRNDYSRRYESKNFQSMQEFKDWMFGLMNRPYADDSGKNMWFLDNVLNHNRTLDSSARITFRPDWGGADYWIYCVSDNNKVVFSNGKYTNGQCYISEGFKSFLKECQDQRDGKTRNFEFGEVAGYSKDVAVSGVLSHKEENIVNIAMMAGALLREGEIDPSKQEGHLGLTVDIVLFADEFERKFAGINWEESSLDYIEEIDKFSEARLLEKYGVQEKAVDAILEGAVERVNDACRQSKDNNDFVLG